MYCGEKRTDVIEKRHILFLTTAFLLLTACSKKPYDIEYQKGYPNLFADNWIAFEFQGGDIEGEILDPYNLVTSLDPNRNGYLIIDQLYDCDIRVRAVYADTSFSVEMGDQLETISTNTYDVKYLTVKGYITTNPVLTSFTYDLATVFFEHIAFYPEDIKDVLFLRAGLYDEYKTRVDSILVIGYRKTGFEDVNY
jgi:hypothetical protein